MWDNDITRNLVITSFFKIMCGMTSCVEPSRETGGREKRLKPTGGVWNDVMRGTLA